MKQRKRARKGKLRRYWSAAVRQVRSSWSAQSDAPWARRLWYAAAGVARWPFRIVRLMARRVQRLLVAGWRHPASRSFAYGLPALLTGAGLMAIALAPRGKLAADYQIRASNAFQARDYAMARTCYERLVQIDPSRDENLFRLALTLEALGETRRTAALMQRLAPADSLGYPKANVWQARRLLATVPVTAEAKKSAERHLRRALQGDRDNPDAHALLGQICLVDRRLDEAETHLRQAMITQPRHELDLARVKFARGDRELGLWHAKQAASYLSRIAEADTGDLGARLLWAEALLLAQNHAGAITILKAGLNLSESSAYRLALARAYAGWFDALAQDQLGNDAERLTIIEAGLQHDPGNGPLIQRLVMLTRYRGKEAEKARAMLQRVLAEGKAPASIHLLLGVDAWGRGQTREAHLHFQRAYELAPQMPEVANNIAWSLAHDETPDLPRALALINSALERHPKRAQFLDTRGQILVKLGRWDEALKDLEAALPDMPNDRALHRALADAYKHLGNATMAKEHERRAKGQSQ